jgi:flagellar hook assembly protein FlgD
LPEQGNVELTVYNSLGQKVKTLVNKHQQAGYHSYIFNGNSVASGIYFYSLKTASYQQTRKMLLIK